MGKLLIFFATLISLGFAKAEKSEIHFQISKDKRSILKMSGTKIIKVFTVISKCGAPFHAKPEIWSLKEGSTKIQIVYGKHDYAEIDKTTEELRCLGSD